MTFLSAHSDCSIYLATDNEITQRVRYTCTILAPYLHHNYIITCTILAPYLHHNCIIIASYLYPTCTLLAPYLRHACAILAPYVGLRREVWHAGPALVSNRRFSECNVCVGCDGPRRRVGGAWLCWV